MDTKVRKMQPEPVKTTDEQSNLDQGSSVTTIVIRFSLPSWLPVPRLLAFLFLISVTALIYGAIQWKFSNLANPESYLHLSLSQILLNEGFVGSFPWIRFSIVAERFVDLELLLHVLHLPFLVTGVDPTTTGKLFALLSVLVLALGFYTYLISNQVRWPLLFTGLLLSASPYLVHHLCFVRSTTWFFLQLLALLHALHRAQPRLLFIIGALGAYTTPGFVLLWILSSLFSLFLTLENSQRDIGLVLRDVGMRCAPVIIGSLLALVANPYFPNNLTLLKIELIDQLFMRPHDLVSDPQWRGMDSVGFLHVVAMPLLLLGIAQLAAARLRVVFNPMLSTLYIAVWGFFLLAMHWLWAVEYFVFFAILFCALLVSRFIEGSAQGDQKELIRRIALGVFLFLCLPLAVASLKTGARAAQKTAALIQTDSCQQAADWLANNSQPGDVVIADSDDVPVLLFFSRHNYYPFGINPFYTHAGNEALYLIQQTLFKGALKDPETYMKKIDARYVLVTGVHSSLKSQTLSEQLKTNPYLHPVFSSRSAYIFGLKE